jgi:hypothetical protein
MSEIKPAEGTVEKGGTGTLAGSIRLLLAAAAFVLTTCTSHASMILRDRGEWVIQVGAPKSEAEAKERLRTARQYAQPLLDNTREYIETVDKGSKRLYRARFAVDFDMVKPVCVTLKKANVSCVAISPTLPTNAKPIVVTPASAPPAQSPSASPQLRTTSPPHRTESPQPKSIWQAIKDTTGHR